MCGFYKEIHDNCELYKLGTIICDLYLVTKYVHILK